MIPSRVTNWKDLRCFCDISYSVFSFSFYNRDCYVAVSGIPISRSDHAIIMAKFARDLLHCLSEELAKLVPVLGSATASLAMRVGKFVLNIIWSMLIICIHGL